MSLRRSRAWMTAAAVSVASLVASPVLAAPPTGNAHAISILKTADRVSGVRDQVQVMVNEYWYGVSSGDNWYLSWNDPSPTYSYQHRVDETTVVDVSDSKVVWLTDEFAPCSNVSHCSSSYPPLLMYFRGSKAYWALLDQPGDTASCLSPATGSTSWVKSDFDNVGETVDTFNSDKYETPFDIGPATTSGPHTIVPYTFSYPSTGQKVTASSTIQTATHLFIAQSDRVSAGSSSSDPGYHYSLTFSYPTVAPAAPDYPVCS